MGSCANRGLEVPPEDAGKYIKALRSQGKDFCLLVALQDQYPPSRVLLSGAASSDMSLVDKLGRDLQEQAGGVVHQSDASGELWDVSWVGTEFTTLTHGTPWLPEGRALARILDTLAGMGWTAADGPTFGGPDSKHKSVSWPVLVLRRSPYTLYTSENLVFVFDEHSHPGKLCAIGPSESVDALEPLLTQRLRAFNPSTFCNRDRRKERSWDAVWHKTSFTAGANVRDGEKPYFPKGTAVHALIEEVYKQRWRLVSAPSFGGDGYDWTCLVFRRLQSEPQGSEPPPVLLVAPREQGMPGKLCLAGPAAAEVAEALLEAFSNLKDQMPNLSIVSDRSDISWSSVVREARVTIALDSKKSYFPKNDAMMAMLRTLNKLGWSLAACPNFGGAEASWPTMVFEKVGRTVDSAFVAIQGQDSNCKVCVGGAKSAKKPLLSGFRALNGAEVAEGKDSSDETFDFCIRDAVLNAGTVCTFSSARPWQPYGYVLEMLLNELGSLGWRLVGSPTFGSCTMPWPTLIFERIRDVHAYKSAMAPAVVREVATAAGTGKAQPRVTAPVPPIAQLAKPRLPERLQNGWAEGVDEGVVDGRRVISWRGTDAPEVPRRLSAPR